MTATGKILGHSVFFDGSDWRFLDTGELTAETWRSRACDHCGIPATHEGHDGCLRTLPGVRNACCGHGNVSDAYLQFETGEVVRGREAAKRLLTLSAGALLRKIGGE